MSLPLDLLGKVIVALTAGTGVAIPISQALKNTSVERVKLKDEEDLKNSCLIVLQGGERGESDNQDKKLIVCQRDKNPWTTEFYLYSDSTPFNLDSLRKVQKIEISSGSTEAVLVFEESSESSRNETIKNPPPRTWTSLSGLNLKEKTQVNLTEKKIYFEDILKRDYRDLKEFSQ